MTTPIPPTGRQTPAAAAASWASRPGPDWWRSAVIYQIYPRSFQDSDGDGNGDLAGVAQRIDYLNDLGVDAVWLSPFFRSPMRDGGYDVSDYADVDPVFGSLADFDRLIDALHRRGIRLILDFVGNHTSDRHPWFQESRSARRSARRDWYVWRDPAPDGGPPNNWRSQFGGPAWTLDRKTGQYYCHSFLACQPDLDWSNPQVRAAMAEVMRFWLARGVDGFRFDAVGRIAKHPAFADDPPDPNWRPGDPDWRRFLRVNSGDGPQLGDYVAELRAMLAAFSNAPVLMGETYAAVPRLAALYGAGLQLPTNMNLLLADWTARDISAVVEASRSVLPDEAVANWVIGNHDQARVASRVGAAQARAAMALLLTLRGAPTIYQGDELGLENVEVAPQDAHDKAADPAQGIPSRDPYRSPMPWNGGRQAGFSIAKPWLPIGPANALRNVAAQTGANAGMLETTRALIALRKREPAFAVGAQLQFDLGPEVVSFARQHADRRFVVALNPSPTRRVRLPWTLTGRIEFSTAGRDAGREVALNELAENEATIIGPMYAGQGEPT